MSDPVDTAPRRRRVWPLAAMSALIGLLATFLVVKFTRPADDTPETVRTPPPPEPPPPPKSAVDPADALLADAEAALKDGRWDEAARKAEQARATRGAAAAAILARIQEARKGPRVDDEERKRREEAAAREKARREREEALLELERIVAQADEHVAAFRWDAALAAYEDGLKKHPALGSIEDFVASRRRVVTFREDAAKAFAGNAERARAEMRAGRTAAALKFARMAGSLYPENPAGAALLREISSQALEANLVPIPATIKGGVKLGDATKPDEPERVFESPGFLMDRYEVTNEEYLLFVHQTGHRAPPSARWASGEPKPEDERLPVTHIAASDAEAFAKWAGKRLPTEDEWEYAARWVDSRVYPWGSSEPSERNPACQSLEASLILNRVPEIKAVGSWPDSQSPFGIHDLAGNVWEWTSTTDGARRILKGGSFLSRVTAARASNRLADDPDLIHPDAGFRCVKDRP